ncbi:hypothetical protein SARC_10021 [Sphaeroforma arctica JP610]|uniref:Uncharacterized protein n=1 Tax=Sphaeroforma arctica JP610 TaxID=667725 RepID=A0A0L0FL63_9EUKA|nr:hypothetical protein SARC_10021 [Sphaeroforma arctica JP610]KNC77519.1 hypothetical protein SARC_10021 [Sphaeroforma arctica JP610]|eukprot:XP_014151421.1 hypothetical protein SARC_10021 [Sphaeroforma arctica JP610]
MADQQSQPQQTIVSRVAAVPIVAYISSRATSLYEHGKKTSVYFNNAATFLENQKSVLYEYVSPVFDNKSFMAYLTKANDVLLSNFNFVVEKYPVIETPAEDIIDAAAAKKAQVLDQANAQLVSASEKVNQQYQSTKESVSQQYSTVSEAVVEKVNMAKDQYNEKAAPVVAEIKTQAEPIIADLQERVAPVVANIKEQASPIVESVQKQYNELTNSETTAQE